MVTTVKIYNTLTNKKEELKTKTPGEVKFYSCGPTTYDFLHVGNARAFVVGDLFARVLKGLGYKVTFVRNFTDIDDKIVERAKELNEDAIEFANRFVDECKKDMASLGMIEPQHSPKVSETLDEIVNMIQKIIDSGAGYIVDGEVLFNVPKFKGYGKLSKKVLDDLQHGKRIEVDEKKKNSSDFVLWKPAKAGEPAWDSPWGKGRPGWHIECSAMARKFLGDTIDLHHGGIDLIFPHHENEIAQSEMANGKEFCANWCHNEFVNFGHEKMSKSLGNVVTIRKFVEIYGGQILRQIHAGTQYRAKVDWSDELIERAINDVERIHHFVIDFRNAKKDKTSVENQELEKFKNIIPQMKEHLSNDFNVPGALSSFFVMIREARRDYLNLSDVVIPELIYKEINDVLNFVEAVLGLVHIDPKSMLEQVNQARKNLKGSAGLADADIQRLIEERKMSKKNKDFARADQIRKQLKSSGIELLDHPDGTVTWKYE